MSTRRHHTHAERQRKVRRHYLVAGVLGLAIGVGARWAHLDPSASFLLAMMGAIWTVALPVLRHMLHETPTQTREHFKGQDPGRTTSDAIILCSALAALVGVGWMFLGRPSNDTAKVLQGLLAIAAVGSGWFVIHLMYAMRYARHWFNAEPRSIDFHTEEPPAYSDFLYTAFSVGMSYAISDTDLCTTKMRRIALGHAWLSYVFGTVIVAATINLVVGLAN